VRRSGQVLISFFFAPRLGAFCGYRNIQNLCSHIIGTRATGWEQLGSDIPSVFQIQDLIETAWDRGFNARGRAETGGIKGTRKYIGTPEVGVILCTLSRSPLSDTFVLIIFSTGTSILCQHGISVSTGQCFSPCRCVGLTPRQVFCASLQGIQ
jgi:hypothetical protein